MATLDGSTPQRARMSQSSLTPGYEALVEKCLEKYPSVPRMKLVFVARRLQAACADVRDLIDRRILDLGCGSEKSKDHPSFLSRVWSGFQPSDECKPWYCRMAAVAKKERAAEVVGIDLGTNRNEPFTGIQADLKDFTLLERMREGSFDIINNHLFTNPLESANSAYGFSPSLAFSLRKKSIGQRLQRWLWGAAHPQMNNEDRERLLAFHMRVDAHVQRLLSDGGTYTFGPLVYRKEGVRLVKTGETR